MKGLLPHNAAIYINHHPTAVGILTHGRAGKSKTTASYSSKMTG
jgi:hypothetical protein